MGGLKHRLMESNEGTEADGGRPNPAEVNAQGNRAQLSRRQQIADRLDGSRAADLEDTDGREIIGRFADGEFDDTPEGREARALAEDEEARQALEEEAERARAEELQTAGDGEDPESTREVSAASPGDGGDAPEEKLINGVKHYLVVTPKGEKWLTFPQLRALAQKVEAADETLQRANDALKRSTQLALAPREEPGEELSDEELEAVVSSAVMGDREAIKKLSTAIKARPSKTPDVSQEVARAIATRSAVTDAEQQIADVLSVETLVPVFRARLRAVADAEPELSIQAAYKKAAEQVRKDFAPMLKAKPGGLQDKAQRKRTLVTPPAAASRAVRQRDEEGEENPTSVIDQIAKGRGQARAIRHGRNLSQG
jgi:hypothetical protein